MDLWQIHEVIYENNPDLHFTKGGVVEALDEAKKQGKVRFELYKSTKKYDRGVGREQHRYLLPDQLPL